MNKYPRMLKVETGWLERTHQYFPTDEFIDYHVYDNVPRWWRWVEERLRMDIYLAWRARQIADRYDIIWANSEKVAIPLSFLNIKKKMVVILQYPESPLRAILIRLSGMVKTWDGVGIVARDARKFVQESLGVEAAKIFQYFAARTDLFKPAEPEAESDNGPILSMGVAKRDYDTLVSALAGLPGYRTDIYVSSQYGDRYQGKRFNKLSDWIRFPAPISENELRCEYQNARFVVVPLVKTSHSGAGVTSVFEASASGKAVIATATGGMHSFVVDGKTGILVPPGNVSAMRNAIQKLWENPALATEMGTAGRKFVEEHYAYEKVVQETTTFLQQLYER